MTKTIRGIVYTASDIRGQGVTLYFHQRMGSRLTSTKEAGFSSKEAAMQRAEEIALTNYNPYGA